jgi:ferredoxin-thioredoxin reductase catalytic subunit
VKGQNDRRRRILDFAQDNGYVINPARGYEYYVESFVKFKACPCDANRLDCPCPEAVDEVKTQGWCKCRLFWESYEIFKDSRVPEV